MLWQTLRPRMRLSICQIPARMMRPGTRLRPMVFLLSERDARCGTYSPRTSIKFKPVEADTLFADGHLGEVRADLGIEAIAVHPEVARCITKADDPRNQGSRLKMVTVGFLPSLRRTETSPASSSHANPRYFALRSRPNRRMALFEKATT